METVDNVENNIQQKRTLISKINSDRLPKPVSKIYDVELIRRLLQDCALYSPHNNKGVVKTSSRSASATDADEHNIYPEEDVHYLDEERRKQGRREVWGSLLGGSNKPTRRWHFAPTPISEIKKQRIWYLNLQRRRRVEPRNDDPSEPSRPATPSSAGDASAWEYDTEEERLAYMTEETDGPFGQRLMTDGSFCLKNLTQADGVDTIITFNSPEEMLVAHSSVLVEKSPLFAKMLDSQHQNRVKIVRLERIDSPALLEVLRYMYTGKVRSFAFDDVARVLSTARRFQLEEQIGYQYASTIDNLNCKLTIAQLDIICKYANKDSFDILVRTIFQRPEALNDVEFGLLNQETVEAIIKSDALPVEELDILKAVYFWSECEARRKGIEKTARNLRALLGPVFYQVRFPLIDIKVLNRNNLPYTMLTKIELEGLNDMSNGLLHRVPKKFSSKKRSEALPTTDTSVLTCHKSTSAPVHSIDPTYLPRKINKRSASIQNIPKACLPIVSTCSYETIPVISESEFRQLRQTHHFQGSKYVGLHSIQRFKYITGPLELKYAEEVSFTCSECVILNGIQLFGTYRDIGSYNGTIEVSLSQQANILREKFAFESECKKPKLYDIYFRTPVIILAKQTYTICVSIEGPGTFFGINGSRFVESKTGVVFKFVDSGELDVFVGQMPGLLFSIPLNKELEKYE